MGEVAVVGGLDVGQLELGVRTPELLKNGSWPLTQIFKVSFVSIKIIDLPCQGNTLPFRSSQKLTRLRLGPF